VVLERLTQALVAEAAVQVTLMAEMVVLVLLLLLTHQLSQTLHLLVAV
jgi:hypothetical protein